MAKLWRCMACGNDVSLVIFSRTVSPRDNSASAGPSMPPTAPLKAQKFPVSIMSRIEDIRPPIMAPRMPPMAPPSISNAMSLADPRSGMAWAFGGRG